MMQKEPWHFWKVITLLSVSAKISESPKKGTVKSVLRNGQNIRREIVILKKVTLRNVWGKIFRATTLLLFEHDL